MVRDRGKTTAAGTPWGRVAGIVSAVAVALAVLVVTFAWPAARSAAEGLSIAVTGDAELVGELTAGLEGGLPDAVDLVEVDDREAIATGVAAREFIGGVVLTRDAPEVLTASAAGQVPSAFMTGLAAQLQTASDAQVYAGVTEGLRGALQPGLMDDPGAVLDQLPDHP